MRTNAVARPGTRHQGEAAVLDALCHDLDAGFVVLFHAHQREVFSSALRICGSRTDAEDLTAEAFLRAYRALATYDRARLADLHPRPWLLAILVNVWRNHRRSMNRRVDVASRGLPRDLPPERPELGDGVERLAERREDAERLGSLLARLPAAQRVAVVLRHVNGLSIAEIAAVLQCPPGTAKSHVSRGLGRLRSLCKGGDRP